MTHARRPADQGPCHLPQPARLPAPRLGLPPDRGQRHVQQLPDSERCGPVDAAVRAHAEGLVDDGEVITNWIVLAATRRFDGGGVVIHMVSDESLPTYVARGMFSESLAKIDRRMQASEEHDSDD